MIPPLEILMTYELHGLTQKTSGSEQAKGASLSRRSDARRARY